MLEETAARAQGCVPAGGEDPPLARQGTIIGERYVIGELLGEGGMGEVFEARHLVIGRRFAIKFLRPRLALSQKAVARFRGEAQAVGALEHPNIAAVLDFGATRSGDPYIVLEYLEGEDLARYFKRGRLDPALAAWFICQAAQGLEAAHAHGIVHRDLKPANLFVCRQHDGTTRIKVLDFGIAKLDMDRSDGPSSTRHLTGTPSYMAPEQVSGDSPVDCRTDIYALGAILYQALTGLEPHPGPTREAILFHVLRRDPVRLRELRPGISSGLSAVVETAMRREPDQRFQSARALLQALSPHASAEAARWALEPSVSAGVGPGESATLATAYTDEIVAPSPAAPERRRRVRRSLGLVVGVPLVVAAGALAGTRVAGEVSGGAPGTAPPQLDAPARSLSGSSSLAVASTVSLMATHPPVASTVSLMVTNPPVAPDSWRGSARSVAASATAWTPRSVRQQAAPPVAGDASPMPTTASSSVSSARRAAAAPPGDPPCDQLSLDRANPYDE